jgi:hypothetical protein
LAILNIRKGEWYSMLRFTVVCFLLAGFLLAPLAAKARLRDETVVLYLPFEEGSGEETKDLSNSGKIGVLSTTGNDLPEWVDGKFGKALEFDGETNFVEVQDTPDFSFASDPGTITLAAWVKVIATGTDAHDQTRQPIVMKGDPSAWEYALYIYDGGIAGMSVWDNGGTGVAEPSGGTTIMDDQWHAVVGTFDSEDGVKVYVDGNLVTEAAPNQNVPGNGQRNVVVGHREDGQFLNAIIDDVRIWDRVLEDDEIAETMASPLSGLAVHPDGSLAWKWGQIKVGH